MKKYLGNKSKFASFIYENILNIIDNNCTVFFDAFAGTTNVGRYFKENGFSVITNDINDVTYILGKVYIEINEMPEFSCLFDSPFCYSGVNLAKLRNTIDFINLKKRLIELNLQTNSRIEEESRLLTVLTYLTFYATERDYSIDDRLNFKISHKDFIYRNYCERGSNSEYINLVTAKSLEAQSNNLNNIKIKLQAKYSSNNSLFNNIDRIISLFRSFKQKPYSADKFTLGLDLLNQTVKESALLHDPTTTRALENIYTKLLKMEKRSNYLGKRIFFSDEHGRKIDIVLNTILFWLKNSVITENEFNILLCSLIESVALYSNTSATYQAFYKTYQANTKQEFRLVIPEIYNNGRVNYVFKGDAFNIVESINIPYDILYLDPPYNWRLYDSNYHLLNLIAKYHTIEDLSVYEEGLLGAAGEYRFEEANYTNLNRRKTFEEVLFELIKRASCRYVAISYSDSNSNHNKNSTESIEKIKEFLTDTEIFVEGSFRLIPFNSIKFESRKDQKKEKINELLFLAQKKGN